MPAQRGERCRPGDACRGKSGPALVAGDRGLEVRPVAAVEVARGETVPREAELKCGHVPAHVARTDRAASEAVASQPSQRTTGERSGYAVDRQVGAPLETRHRRAGRGTVVPVDR